MKFARGLVRVLLILAGAYLVGNTIFLIPLITFNLGLAIMLVMGLVLLAYGIFFNAVHAHTEKPLPKAFRWLCVAGLCFMAAVIAFLAGYGASDTATGTEDAVIVLGAGLEGETVTMPLYYRLDTAARYYEEIPDCVIVVTGGQGPYESITEALAMERFLVSRGVPADKIIKEEKATSTYENFVFSKELLDQKLGEGYSACFITNKFHTYRAGCLAKIVGLNVTHEGAPMDWYLVPVMYLREFFAVVKMWVFRS